MKNFKKITVYINIIIILLLMTFGFAMFDLLPSEINIYQSEIDDIIASKNLVYQNNVSVCSNSNKLNLKRRFGKKIQVNILQEKKVFLGGKPLGIVLREKSLIDRRSDYNSLKAGCASGIGTLSFITENSKFGALGHSILSTENLDGYTGEVYDCKLNGVVKGKNGNPGQLCGEFGRDDGKIGDIEKNCATGIYGNVLSDNYINKLEQMAICSRYAIRHGKAQILTTVDKELKSYDAQIVKCMSTEKKNNKSFLIKITDRDLINKTGGIVQGMSGSPIIQDNKLVGVVTHVFVRDPLRGYGIYLDWMLDDCF